jgi:hypothetical protein
MVFVYFWIGIILIMQVGFIVVIQYVCVVCFEQVHPSSIKSHHPNSSPPFFKQCYGAFITLSLNTYILCTPIHFTPQYAFLSPFLFLSILSRPHLLHIHVPSSSPSFQDKIPQMRKIMKYLTFWLCLPCSGWWSPVSSIF